MITSQYATITPKSQAKYFGATAYMTCNSGTYVPQWSKQGKRIRRGHKLQDNVLIINKLKYTDSGTYTCKGVDFTSHSTLLVGGNILKYLSQWNCIQEQT